MVRCATGYEALSFAIRKNSVKLAKRVLSQPRGLIIDDNWTDYLLLIKSLQRGRIKIAKLLLRENCRVNREENTNICHTPLYYATRLGDVEMVKMLLIKGALINRRDLNKDTALYLALKKMNYRIVDIMLRYYLEQTDNVSSQNSDDNFAFSTACMRIRGDIVESFIMKGMSVNHQLNMGLLDSSNCFALHIATKYERIGVIKVLLAHGADPTLRNSEGQIPLQIAYSMKKDKCGRRNKFGQIIDAFLLSFLINNIPNLTLEDKTGLTSFHIACTRDKTNVIEYFLDRRVDVNKPVEGNSHTSAGYTPLHFAIQSKYKKVIILLLEHGASTLIKDAKGRTPFHLAFSLFQESQDFLKFILSKYVPKDVNPINNFGLSHFHIACTNTDTNAVKDFLNNHVDINHKVNLDSSKCPGYTPLHFAVEFNRKEIVEILLQNNADVSMKDKNGFTPLHLACQQNAKKIFAKLKNAVNILVVPRNAGCLYFSMFREIPPEFIDLNKIAEERSQEEIVDLLLDYNSNIDSQDECGKTPVFYACDFDHDTLERVFGKKMTRHLFNVLRLFHGTRLEILKTLMYFKPNLNVYDDNHKTILHYLANVNKPFGDDRKADVAELLLDNGADINARDKSGSTPVHIALEKGYMDLVEVFLQYNVDPNIAEYQSLCTPLHLAIGNNELLAPRLKEIVSGLISKGAEVDRRQLDGKTPLHIAASTRYSNSSLIPLLAVDCDIDCQDYFKNRTALHMACLNRNPENVQNLLRYGADFNITDRYGRTPFFYFYEYQIEVLECRRTIYNFHQIYYIFRDHVKRLKCIGHYVSWENFSYYVKLRDLHKQQRRILNVEKDIQLKCEEEVEKMKSIKLNNYSTLYDILFKDPNKMTLYVENENFTDIVNGSNFKTEFPQYGYLLKLQFTMGIERSKLLKPAKEVLNLTSDISLPDSCSERIFMYLRNQDLKYLIRAQNFYN